MPGIETTHRIQVVSAYTTLQNIVSLDKKITQNPIIWKTKENVPKYATFKHVLCIGLRFTVVF